MQEARAALILEDGAVFWGHGLGAFGTAVGELCFNTSTTGYQEILTDPSYAGQIITFTFPHIGNVGTNSEDEEALFSAARGCVLAQDISHPSSWRATLGLHQWLLKQGLPAIAGLDTRRLTRRIRDGGAPKAVLCFPQDARFDEDALLAQARAWQGLEGLDLAREVTCRQTYRWREGVWGALPASVIQKPRRVLAIDYGAKLNILRSLVACGAEVTVVPADCPAEEILRHEPDGVFLSNGPGDPSATGEYALPVLRRLMEEDLPIFGICLGHQLLALAAGARTSKMETGHRGANHPVKNLATGQVEITSQNHGFCVRTDTLPDTLRVTHLSLFDNSIEGLVHRDRPVFSVQYHPEASPGPQDSRYLFSDFMAMIDARQERRQGRSMPPRQTESA
ncbi:MAG TPA: glutamine-hydrolyzing carbamoyl-phosphate synthase small subunit [Dongiaceae bacterium]|jgi:carbamoyl-phosphate synthase small subunit|nr:glutamine-hydrolyzing carbamoyl-phosphate synthase small subunit [Dongiaceae bacterium]